MFYISLSKAREKLEQHLTENTNEMGKLKVENINLKQALSLAVFNADSVEQYGYREIANSWHSRKQK